MLTREDIAALLGEELTTGAGPEPAGESHVLKRRRGGGAAAIKSDYALKKAAHDEEVAKLEQQLSVGRGRMGARMTPASDVGNAMWL
jgi:hypothetical protein